MNKFLMNKYTKIKNFLNNLDQNKLYICFFNYSAKSKWYNPFILITKFYYFLTKKHKIDHCAHISVESPPYLKISDGAPYRNPRPQIFEANIKHGMIHNDLIERLMHFSGKFYLVELNEVNKEILAQFENEFKGKSYDIMQAVGSAVDDFNWFTRYLSKRKNKGFFCSYLVIELLNRLGYKEADNIIKKAGGKFKVAPYEIFNEFYKNAKILKL
jgi:hypothetical protein